MLQKPPKQLEKPLHFEEVRKFLGVGHDFLYKALQDGKLIGHKLGNRWVVYPKDLIRYLENRPSNRRRVV
jgi:hypothetical protein